jgi:hypothetical protein
MVLGRTAEPLDLGLLEDRARPRLARLSLEAELDLLGAACR